MPTRTSRLKLPRAPRPRSIALAAAAAGAGLAAAAPAAAAPVEPPTLLAKGSAGPAVAEIQRALHVHASGRFDRRTTHAVRAFQRRDHLLVDGIVGVQTWDALFHIAPAPAPASYTPPQSPTTSSTGVTGAVSGASGGYSIPSGIVQCESHGDYGAVNPSSGAGGAYQILPSTWRAYGGQGLPENAAPAEQDRIAAEIYARQGASAWSC